MPRHPSLKKVMVIGSGPIIIGQAAEFDYAGTQACRALGKKGIEVVLVNSNPATIMTDPEMADRIYIEPLNRDFLTRIIARERPRGPDTHAGGQTGLNLAVQLAESGVLEQYGVELLGTPLEAIKKAEDREQFKNMMQEIGEPVPDSERGGDGRCMPWNSPDGAGYPRCGAARLYPGRHRRRHGLQLRTSCWKSSCRGLTLSMIGQVLLERSAAGWKEIEYEVMRDGADNCITICNMENIDPDGQSIPATRIVVAPSQTFTDNEYQMLRTASFENNPGAGRGGRLQHPVRSGSSQPTSIT